MDNHAKRVCDTIKAWLRQNEMTMSDMADKLGVGLSAVTNQLNNRKFGRNNADKYSKQFGFSIPFLLTGEGDLFGEVQENTSLYCDISVPLVPTSARGDTLGEFSTHSAKASSIGRLISFTSSELLPR